MPTQSVCLYQGELDVLRPVSQYGYIYQGELDELHPVSQYGYIYQGELDELHPVSRYGYIRVNLMCDTQSAGMVISGVKCVNTGCKQV